LNLILGRLTVPNIESRCNQLKLGHPLPTSFMTQNNFRFARHPPGTRHLFGTNSENEISRSRVDVR
jgi:hypothetical protein